MCPVCAIGGDSAATEDVGDALLKAAADARQQGAVPATQQTATLPTSSGVVKNLAVAEAAEEAANQLETWGTAAAVVYGISGAILLLSGFLSLDVDGGMGFVGIGAGIGCLLAAGLFHVWHRAGATALLLLGKLALRE